jgi:hypothetical protein
MAINVTLTDTFGGEPNFSWVRKFEINNLEEEMGEEITPRKLIKKIREEFGIPVTTKLRKAWECGDEIRYNLDKCCQTILIEYV